MSTIVSEWLGIAFFVLVIASALTVSAIGVYKLIQEKSPPGFLPQYLVSSLVPVVILLGGYGVSHFESLVRDSSVALAALIPLSLSPWLIYKAKQKKGDHEVETETKPPGGTP